MHEERLASDDADLLKHYFSPTIAVLASEGAEQTCGKNGLTCGQLLKPFERLPDTVTFKDPSNQTVDVVDLRLDFRDLRRHGFLPGTALRTALWDMMRSWKVPPESSGDQEPFTMPLESSPWFRKYRSRIAKSLEPFHQEFLRCYLACIFVVSTSDEDPWECLSSLLQQQHTQQHQPNRPDSPSEGSSEAKWFCPNILKYHVLIHDVHTGGNAERADAVFQRMQKAYGSHACHLLLINSARTEQENPEAAVDQWSPWLLDACNLSAQCYPNVDEESPADQEESLQRNFANLAMDTLGIDRSDPPQLGETIRHPLSTVDLSAMDGGTASENDQSGLETKPTIRRGQLLTRSDVEGLKEMINEFCRRALLPYVERQLKFLNDVVSSRKGIGKSLLNATKKWLSGSSAPNLSALAIGSLSSGAGVNGAEKTAGKPVQTTLPAESWEMQGRRLADLAFLFQHYELAYQMYHMIRKEFSTQQAWFHYASSCEMTTICVYLLGNRAYPRHYIEAAVSTYADECRRPWFAFRAAMLSAAMLFSSSHWVDAATQLVKVIDKDGLSGAIFLEEAARCFFTVGMRRKAAFHLVLAGNRYSKVALRQHAVLCYSRALRMYKQRFWNAAEAHINMALGQLHHSLKEKAASNAAFERLYMQDLGGWAGALQQQSTFNEYLSSLKSTEPDQAMPKFVLPRLHQRDTLVYCNILTDEIACYDGGEPPAVWERMEHSCAAYLAMGQSYASACCLGRGTRNVSISRAPVGQPIAVVLRLSNPLNIAIGLIKLRLLCTLRTEDGRESDECITVSVIDEYVLKAKAENVELTLSVNVRREGLLTINGIAYGLCGALASESGSENPETYSYLLSKASAVFGSQALIVPGRRLNATKDQRTGRFYETDSRLSISIVSEVPMLNVDVAFASGNYFDGQIISVPVTISNIGNLPVDHMCASAHPTSSVLVMAVQSCSPTATVYRSVSNGDCIVYNMLPDGYVLPPGSQVITTMCIRASGGAGGLAYSDIPTTIRIVFYWTTTLSETDRRQKSFRWKTTFTVVPSVNMDIQCRPLPHYSVADTPASERILVVSKVHNVSQMCRMKLHGVAMHSTNAQLLESLLSERREYDIAPDQWESVCFVIARRCSRNSAEQSDSHLSLLADNVAEAALPFAVQPWYPFKLISDQSLVSVFWSTVIQCSDGSMNRLYGQVCRPFVSAVADSSEKSTEDSEAAGCGVMNYNLIYTPSVSHDFTQSRLCCIPVELKLFNGSDGRAALVRVQCVDRNSVDAQPAGTRVHDVLWTGLCSTRVTVPPAGMASVSLTAIATTASVVDLKFGLRIEVEESDAGRPYLLNLQSHFVTVHAL